MKQPITALAALAVLATLGAGVQTPRADELEAVPPVTHQPTLKECGECHMAYQPALLPRESWAAIMDDLSNHFGEDASLPPELTADIKAYLVGASAPSRRDAAQPLLKITEQRWWLHEHDEIRASAWQDPKIGAKGNCVACHKGAEQGLYEDEEDGWGWGWD